MTTSKVEGVAGKGSARNGSFITALLANETIPESLVTRGYAIIQFSPATAIVYASLYDQSKAFFSAPDKIKRKYAQIQFDDNNRSPNSLFGFSLVKDVKEQFMIRSAAKQQLKTPGNDFITDHRDDSTNSHRDFGVLGLVLFEKLDVLCRSMMGDILNLFNKPQRIMNDILDPINKIDGTVTRDGDQCHAEYMLDGYISSSVLDCYHYFPSKHDQYGHGVHADSGLLTVIPMTPSNPSLQVFDQRENEWIDIERLIVEYCKANGRNMKEFGVMMNGESVDPYINRHIESSENRLKPCFYRIDNGKVERHSVVFKQRTAPLRSHARYQEDFFLAKLHSEIDVDSVHSRLMKKETDRGKEAANYRFYEYSSQQKSQVILVISALTLAAVYFLKRKGILQIHAKLCLE